MIRKVFQWAAIFLCGALAGYLLHPDPEHDWRGAAAPHALSAPADEHEGSSDRNHASGSQSRAGQGAFTRFSTALSGDPETLEKEMELALQRQNQELERAEGQAQAFLHATPQAKDPSFSSPPEEDARALSVLPDPAAEEELRELMEEQIRMEEEHQRLLQRELTRR